MKCEKAKELILTKYLDDAFLKGEKAALEDHIHGCEKCWEVCPTECIEMRPATQTVQNWVWPVPEFA